MTANYLAADCQATRTATQLWALLLLCAGLTLNPPAAVAQSKSAASDTAKTSPASDVQDLVFFAPGKPLFLRIHVQIDKKGFRDVQSARVDKIFSALDADRSGFLDKQEGKRMPLPEQLGPAPPGTSVAWEEIDKSPRDGKVSRGEFRVYALDAMGSPFSIRPKQLRQAQTVRLFAPLDADGDGALSRAELQQAAERLRKFDGDDNEILNVGELQTLQRNRSAESDDGQNLEDYPFLVLESGDSLKRTAKLLLRRYGTESKTILPEKLGLTGDAIAQFDRDADGTLNAGELRAFLKRPLPHVEFSALLVLSGSERPKMEVLELASDDIKIEQANPEVLTLSVGGVEVALRAAPRPLTTTYDVRQFYLLKFLMADGDSNQYLSEEEFAQIGLPNPNFKAVDRDSDGKVFRDELVQYVVLEAATSAGKLDVSAGREGRSVFELLDRNVDGRLSQRELRRAVESVAEYDLDGNGMVASTEMSRKYELKFQTGQSQLLSTDRPVAAPGDGGGFRTPDDRSGPLWFQRMDRNRDGDVSWKEFLGKRAVFDRLDVDADGLIDDDEAALAGAKSRG